MSFSPDEKQKAQAVTYNIGTYIIGNLSHSQVGPQNSVQYNFDVTKLNDFIGVLKNNLEGLQLDADKKAELNAEIRTLESQAASPKPKDGNHHREYCNCTQHCRRHRWKSRGGRYSQSPAEV
jgi:hypothetical protein